MAEDRITELKVISIAICKTEKQRGKIIGGEAKNEHPRGVGTTIGIICTQKEDKEKRKKIEECKKE